MPLLTSVDDLTARMRLHEPVYDGMQLLLPAGKVLNSADVDFLRKRCPAAQVYIEDPVLDGLVTFQDDTRDREIAQKTQTKLIELLSDVQDRFASRMKVKSIDCRGIQEAIDGVLDYLHRNPVMAMSLMKQPGRDQHYLVLHSAHVFYLSLVVGNAVRRRVSEAHQKTRMRTMLQRPPEIDLTNLGLAALFMDLGMWPIKDLFDQAETLTVEQIRLVRNHTLVSAKALPEDTNEVVRLVIETHHENYDGSGYPYGLRDDEIHLFARILRIADAYAAATSKQLYREALSPVRALWEMTWGPFAQFYDPVLLKIFASLLQPFPIGAKLELSCGRYGVVVRYGQVSPFLPEIIIAFDEKGRHLTGTKLEGPIKLHQRSDLKIVSYQNEDLSDLYRQDTTIEPATPSEFTTLFESMYTGCATTSLRP